MARYVIQNRISDYRVVQLEEDLGLLDPMTSTKL
jgi:hypothetical protein